MQPAKLPFYWLPHRIRLVYLCQDRELHELTAWVWGRWTVRRADRMLVDMPALLNLTFAMGQQSPVDEEGAPVLQ
jgi:hypothetical protein